MKIRVVSSKEDIDNLCKDEEMIHLTFRPSIDDIFFIVARCPRLKAFQMPASYLRSISRTTHTFLEMEDIAILEGELGGNRNDINEYSEISQQIYETIDNYLAEDMPDWKIRDIISRETNMSPDLVRYLIINRNQ